jgi:hypothetical protein
MNDVIREIETKRKELYLKYKSETKNAFIATFIVLIITGITFSIQPEFGFFVLFFLIVPIIMFGGSARHQKTFRSIVKSEMIQSILKEKFEDVRYDPLYYIPQQVIDGVGLVKRADRFSGEDYMAGKYGSIYFEASDITMRERVEHRDSKGNRTVSYPIYFKGRWYIFKFEKELDGVLKISEGHPRDSRGLMKIEMESIVFNKKFKTYASNQNFAFTHLKPIMMEKLLELEKLHKGTIHFCYSGKELHIGVNDSFDYLEFPFSKEINEASLKIFMSDIDLIPAIIEEMKLESRKFKN